MRLECRRYVTYSDARAPGVGPAELRERRTALKLAQADFGRLLGMSRNTVARWERGELAIQHPELVNFAIRALEQPFGDTAALTPRQPDTTCQLKSAASSAASRSARSLSA